MKSRRRGFGFYKNEVFTRVSKKLTLAQTSSNLKGCTLEKNKTILRNETSEDKPKLGVTALGERGLVIGPAEVPNDHQRAAKTLIRDGRGLLGITFNNMGHGQEK